MDIAFLHVSRCTEVVCPSDKNNEVVRGRLVLDRHSRKSVQALVLCFGEEGEGEIAFLKENPPVSDDSRMGKGRRASRQAGREQGYQYCACQTGRADVQGIWSSYY